jgi:hypothetical protein
MTDFMPKKEMSTHDGSDAKKSYAHPDVIDLLSVDETEGKTVTAAEDDPLAGLS